MSQERLRPSHCFRALALLSLIIVLAAAAALLPWWQKISEYDAQSSSYLDQLERYRNMNQRRPELLAQLAAIREQLRLSEYYIDAATPALAAAELQKKAKQVVEQAGGKLVSTQNIAGSIQENPGRIAVRVRMTGGVEIVAEVLHALEGGRPLLFVEELTIRSNKRVRGRRGNRTTEFVLDSTFDLVGFLRGDAT